MIGREGGAAIRPRSMATPTAGHAARWKARWGILARMGRPNKSGETREQIVGAALALLDAEGADALSTRRLARELGIRGPTLYHYFASKDALVDAVARRIVEEIWAGVAERLDGVEAGDWEGALRGYVNGALDVLGRHPNAVGLLALRPVSNRCTLAGYETMLARLTACGWSLGFAWRVFLAAENLMLAGALEAGAPAFAPAPEATEGLPHVQALVAELAADPSLDAGFEVGLDALIAGVAASLAAQR
jgi:AcrR family transcriptional regulator